MRLMNHKFFYRSSFCLFLLSCSENEPAPFANPLDIPPDLTNELNLKSNSGDLMDSVTLTWNNLGSAELTNHSSVPPITIIPSGNSHIFSEMEPGQFMDISILVNITDDSTYVDSIQIFTRPVYPVTNFEFDVEQVMRGNKIWDEGESYTDSNEDEIWNAGEEFIDIEYPKYHRNLT